jgi:hypothetical protein
MRRRGDRLRDEAIDERVEGLPNARSQSKGAPVGAAILGRAATSNEPVPVDGPRMWPASW